ncbi:MAG: type II toxin-antitoxin system RelE/ParE family toxin [Mobilitalea sp.]
MKKTFIQTKGFSRNWDELGFTDKDLHRLKNEILKNPEAGAIMKGTGGLRKMRFAYEGRGKSGSVRVCYVDFEVKKTIYLITVFVKADQENLTNSEKNNIKTMISNLKKELSKGE